MGLFLLVLTEASKQAITLQIFTHLSANFSSCTVGSMLTVQVDSACSSGANAHTRAGSFGRLLSLPCPRPLKRENTLRTEMMCRLLTRHVKVKGSKILGVPKNNSCLLN